MPNDNDLQRILDITVDIARGAGAILREGYTQIETQRDTVRIDYKGETDPVTEYDYRSEAFIVAALRQEFPYHAVVGEEGGTYVGVETRQGESLLWQVDPLDGTVNFAHGFPVFSVSLGLLHDGVPVVGVVYNPMSDELFSAVKGGGAHLNGRLIRVSRTPSLDRALLNTGFPYDRRTSAENNFDAFLRFQRASQEVRRVGSAALDLCMVACGRMDGYWELKIKPHDISAGIIIVREAGGRVTDYASGDAMIAHNRIVASNGLIHSEMLAVLHT